MEYLDGGDLFELLGKKPVLKPARALAIAAQCASGLAAAHRAGILHRDLKPANVFLVTHEWREDFVKILDFGISKLTRAAGNYSDLTSASKVVGTPCYMSPEQATGEKLDGRCDVYGVGVILFEMLTGRRPFTGKSTLDILTKHLEAPRVAPSSIRPELAAHAGLDELVLTALAPEPEDRYGSMEEFGEAIVECLQLIDADVAGHLFDASGEITAPDGVSPFAETTSDVTRVHHVPKSRLRRAGVLVSVLAAAALVLVLWTLKSGDAKDTARSGAVATGLRHDAAVEKAPSTREPLAAKPSPSPDARPAVVQTPSVADASPAVAHAALPVDAGAAAPVAPAALAPHRVRLTSVPAGARVKIGRRLLGTTPLDVDLEPDTKSRAVVLYAPGRRSRRVTIRRSQSELHVRLLKYKAPRRTPKDPGLGVKEW
jgi:serine/threonine-protein kinase